MSGLIAVEAELTVPPGGWSFLVNGDPKTIAAGPLFPSELAVALDLALTAPPVNANVTVNRTSGKVTITGLSGVMSIDWLSPDLRDALGFAANLSGASTYVGDAGMQGLWIPNCPAYGETFDPATDGHEHSDEAAVRGHRGMVAVYCSNSYRSHRNIVWSHVARERALDGVDPAVVSWQQFVRQSLRGGLSYFKTTSAGVRPCVRLSDETAVIGADGSDGIYRIILSPDLELQRPNPGYTAYYIVEIRELVKV